MLDAISAEALKFNRHRATWGLVWIWPIGIVLLFAVIMVARLLGAESGGREQSAAEWIGAAAGFWNVPPHTFGRYVVGAFTAVVFAGEYGWNTWKLIVPHRARTSLIAAKYAVGFGLLAIGFVLAAGLFNLFGWLADIVAAAPIPAGITAGALLEAHGRGALASLAPVLLTIGYVSLAAVVTRSAVAALVIGLVATTVEQLFLTFGPMLALRAPTLVELAYQVLPGQHLANLGSFILTGSGTPVPLPSGVLTFGWAVSLAVVAGWIAALIGLTIALFRRQDIN